MDEIPEDILEAAKAVAWDVDSDDDPRTVLPIARAILAERERCILRVTLHRGNVRAEDDFGKGQLDMAAAIIDDLRRPTSSAG